MNFSNPEVIVAVVIGLVGIGLYGLLVSRNLIRVVVGLQIAVKGAMLALVLAGRISGKVPMGQSIAITVIVADTIVAVIALGLAVQVKKLFGTLDLDDLSRLRR